MHILVLHISRMFVKGGHKGDQIFKVRCFVFCSGAENFFEILLYQTEIRLYLPFSDLFGTKRTSISFQSNRCMVNTIWFGLDLIRCAHCSHSSLQNLPRNWHNGNPLNSSIRYWCDDLEVFRGSSIRYWCDTPRVSRGSWFVPQWCL